MLLCIRAQINSENKSKINRLLNKDLDWDKLLQIASIHRLTPIIIS